MEGYFIYKKEKLLQMIEKGDVKIDLLKTGKYSVKFKQRLNELGKKPRSLTMDFGSTIEGSKEIEDIFGSRIFSFPKPVSLIKHLIKISSQKNSIILDFFAGSGTTGHAVLELNKEDGGNRQFILATNNENNICEEVTFERIKRVMTGYKNLKGENIEGIGGRLEYLKTDFVDMEKMEMISDDKRLAFTLEAGWTIAMKENVFTEIESNEYYQIFEGEVMDDTKITKNKNKKIENKNHEKNYDSNKKNNEENNEYSLNVENKIIKKTLAIYFKENLDRLEELEEKILDKENVRLYIYSNDIGEFEDDYKEYKNITVCDIPEPILRVYRGN
ncbi:MAG: DNA methyltransferase [Chitinophagaceae bacterium]|nr:DNA methyltransferase [Chitinophagaceae bacterium]